MEHSDIARWIDGYERAWRTPGTGALSALFAEDARYVAAPFDPAIRGREAIAAFWEAERDGHDEAFTLAWEPVALDGDVGVARVEVRYAGPPARTYRDLWVVTLDGDGRCVAFEEWPFFPGQLRATDDR